MKAGADPQHKDDEIAQVAWQAKYEANTMVYQIRHTNGFKLAECTLADEVVQFLRERPAQHYEVWVLSDNPPADLKAVTPAPEFCHKATQKPEDCAGLTI